MTHTKPMEAQIPKHSSPSLSSDLQMTALFLVGGMVLVKGRKTVMSNRNAILSIWHSSGTSDKVMLSVMVEKLDKVLQQALAKAT